MKAAIGLATSLVLACTMTFGTAFAANAAGSLDWKVHTAVPRLQYHLQQETDGFSMEGIIIAKLDLNVPSDGIPEYIVAIENSSFCGTGGCSRDVLRVGPFGKVERLAGILAFGSRLAESTTNGMRYLITDSRNGPVLWRFVGASYEPAGKPPRRATKKKRRRKARSRVRRAKCRGEYGWSGAPTVTYQQTGGYAIYGHCRDGENYLMSMLCTRASREVTVQTELNFDVKADQEFTMRFTTDRDQLERNGKTQWNEMIGYA